VSLKSWWRDILKLVGGSLLLVVACLAIYLAWLWWDMRQLRVFCGEVKAGMPLAEFLQVADRHGIDRRWLKGDGMFDKSSGLWYFYVPSTASVGSNVCAIGHNKVSVVSAVVEMD
jgi:hypothetical protein